MTEAHTADDRGGIASWRWVIPLAFTALLSMFSVLRYHLYLAQGWDLGFYEQGLWALYHEGFVAWSSWGHYPVLDRSFAWILWGVALPYHFLGLGFLLTLQAFAYGSGFVFLYDWMKWRGYPWETIRLVGWLYLINPIAWGIVLFDFHPAVLAIPAILASLTLSDRGLNRPALLWLSVALLCQDSVVIIVAVMGLVWLGYRKISMGFGALILAGLTAALDISAAHHLGHGFYIQKALYFQGKHPLQNRQLGLSLRSAEYLVWLFVPVLAFGWPGRRSAWLIPVIGIAVGNLLAVNPLASSPFSSFSILALPFLVFVLANSSRHTAHRRGKISYMLYAMFFLALLWHEASLRHLAPSVRQNTALALAISKVPLHSEVVAQNHVAAHLANRQVILPLQAHRRYPSGSFVVIDANHSVSMSLTQLAIILGDAKRHGTIIFKKHSIYVIHLSASFIGG